MIKPSLVHWWVRVANILHAIKRLHKDCHMIIHVCHNVLYNFTVYMQGESNSYIIAEYWDKGLVSGKKFTIKV